jgi:hypothetical protein
LENKKYIAFIGDSFTWGQGLYLPYWVDTKPEVLRTLPIGVQWIEHQQFVDSNDLKIKDELSFTSIVAKELGRKCVKKIHNGGDNLANLNIIKTIDRLKVGDIEIDFSFKDNDVILIFQLTHFGRNHIIEYMTESEKEDVLKYNMVDSTEAINKYFKDKVRQYFEHIDTTLETITKEYGIEYWYLDWDGEYWEFRPDKFIDIRVGKNKGKYFSPLTHNMAIEVKFEDRIIRDGHLNEEGNKVLAESILEWLREHSRGVGG